MMNLLIELAYLFLLDMLFVAGLMLLLIPLFFFKQAAFAVLKRNFVGYFNNPIGYVFLCLFVLLSSFAAFWPHEFFTANLANLDQLNLYLPGIMLIFIPAITMSMWSEERRQGTDELLLTLPAADFDIVVGKYLAAAAIFTASLLFSQISNCIVLLSLAMGEVDLGLFLTTYAGYWATGLAMISIGMVASFLTQNLTIGFVLGVLFNMPLVFMKMADMLPSKINFPLLSNIDISQLVSNWSIAAQFEPFGRGVISLSSVIYFVTIIVVGLYLSMVLISARHWYGGQNGHSLFGHYLVRVLSLVIMAFGIVAIFSWHDRVRFDLTHGKISSLSPDTKRLLQDLDPKHPVRVDAFISSDIPERYVKTRINLLSMLKEFEAMAGDDIRVNIHDSLEPFSEEAALAEKQYGIRPRTISVRSRGASTEKNVILGAAFRCGLQSLVVPFFEYGIPVEYELIRSINTVAKPKRKTIGIVRTDARLLGGIALARGQAVSLPRQEIVEELEKQYNVEEVELTQPVDVDRYDMLLAVQPSSLPPEGMQYLIKALQQGMPAAIFEDPLPRGFGSIVPGTGQPKLSPGGNGETSNPQMIPKADIRELWDVLGIQSLGKAGPAGLFQPDIVWQRYNPYPKLQLQQVPNEVVFVRHEPGDESKPLLNPDNIITSGLTELLLPFPGAIEPAPNSDLEFTKLLTTRDPAGTIHFDQLLQHQNNPTMLTALRRRRESMTLAALIQREDNEGRTDKSEVKPGQGEEPATSEGGAGDDNGLTNVFYCADIDLMIPMFLRLRARPDEDDIKWEFENVTFMLNVVDVLAEDLDYINIRKRKPLHATLQVVESRIEEAKLREFTERRKYQEEYDKELEEIEAQNANTLEKHEAMVNELIEKQEEGEQVDQAELREKQQRLSLKQQVLNRRFTITKRRLQRELQHEINRIQRDVDLDIQRIQFRYKFLAVAIPWIPPFLVGVVVFVRRRLREREGIEKSRLR
ncbi:MAG: Gldg family protein [Planctomycetota bacterium]